MSVKKLWGNSHVLLCVEDASNSCSQYAIFVSTEKSKHISVMEVRVSVK